MIEKMTDDKLTIDKIKMIGIDNNMKDNEKFDILLNLYAEKEKALSECIVKFESEREQFEGYIQHISRLSEGREDLILEYEVENNDLKDEITTLKQQLASYQNNETRYMLLNQGMHDIADRSPGEQIAYLLVERARLQDELDARKMDTSSSIHRPEDEEAYQFSELNDLVNRVEHLESGNLFLEQKLQQSCQEAYNEYLQRFKNNSSSNYVDNYEQNKEHKLKSNKSQTNLNDEKERLAVAEAKAAEVDILKEELRKMKAMINDKATVDDGISKMIKLDTEVDISKQNNEMHKMLHSVDSQLKLLASNTDNQSKLSEKPELATQLQNVQKEFSAIKSELAKMMLKYDQQYRKYTENKLIFKNKLFRIKESYKREHQKLRDRIEELEYSLDLSYVSLTKEAEIKENLEQSHLKLLEEQRNLTNQLVDQESRNRKYEHERKVLRSRVKSSEDF